MTLADDEHSTASAVADERLRPVEAETGKPLYLVTRDAIRRAIDDGRFEPGQRMPSTAQMSRDLRVSLVTAHRALGELVGDGVLDRSQGRGTFVRKSCRNGTTLSRATGRIGLVVHRESSLADHYHGQVLEGVRQAAREAKLDLVLLRFGDDLRGECDGFLWVNPLPGEVEAIGERSGRRPSVVVGATAEAADVASVDADNRKLAATAARHLIDLGHRRLGYVGGTSTSNARDRRNGFERACEVARLVLDPAHIVEVDVWTLNESSRQRLQAILTSPDRPTAIFAAGYYYALDTYAAARTVGVELPDELSVVGVDDPPSAAHLSPPLTTLRQPLVELGRRAVAQLRHRLAGEPTQPTSALAAELIVRASTRAA
jgi:LacI family transcriptional regulator